MMNLDPLILDFLEWVAKEPRAYVDVMDAWRTSCPRLTVWEDAMDRALVARKEGASGVVVRITPEGLDFLARNGRVATGTTRLTEPDSASAGPH